MENRIKTEFCRMCNEKHAVYERNTRAKAYSESVFERRTETAFALLTFAVFLLAISLVFGGAL